MRKLFYTATSAVFLFGCVNVDAPVEALPQKKILAAYATQFKRCDEANYFNGRRMKGYRMCRHPNPQKRDLNNLDGFYGLRGQAISFRAKLSLDVDGGYIACAGERGKTDQCPTTYRYKSLSPIDRSLPSWRQKYVTSDLVPYVVIPYDSGKTGRPNDAESREFRKKTGVNIGDVGVVRYRGKVIPVLVADGGPHNKIGEGSLALFDALGDTRCVKRLVTNPDFCVKNKNYSLKNSVEYILFPGSKIKGLTPSNTNAKVSEKAMKLYKELMK